jgi:hypothetical protein
VTQAFCSALPIAYGTSTSVKWKSFATFVLDAAYEAVMWAGVLNAERGTSNVVCLTHLGGGAFGNPGPWIHSSMKRALQLVKNVDLDVRIVTFGPPSAETRAVIEEF